MNPLVLSLVSFFTDAYKARQERKAALESAKAKIQQNKLEHTQDIELSQKEWEVLYAGQLGTTWKDEYVTLIITAPILLFLIGGLWAALTGDDSILRGAIVGIGALEQAGLEMGFLMNCVVLAAIGIRYVRGR